MKKNNRRSGILMHPTSLPGIGGMGSIGAAARTFIDFLNRCEQRIWQMLPLVPIEGGGCPYASHASVAYNAALVDLEDLCEDRYANLLRKSDLQNAPGTTDKADFNLALSYKMTALSLAYNRFIEQPHSHALLSPKFDAFKKKHDAWLKDYTRFEALRLLLDEPLWMQWPEEYKNRDPKALADFDEENEELLDRLAFCQFLFELQWKDLRTYANERNVKIMGDIPIFVSHNSVDVWAHRDIFLLNDDATPKAVAGVPPDYFSPEGQLWGNPLYDWNALEKSDYAWWKMRIGNLAELADIIRIDHFRGFEAVWEVAADAKDAKGGRWVKGPGMAFFSVIKRTFPTLEIVAEDLGILTPAVEELRLDTGFPGMRVLQFGFGPDPNDHHVPHQHTRDSVVYTGTHDNDTVIGWYNAVNEETRDHVRRYFANDGRDIAWLMIRAAMASVADTAIIPVQDLLNLGSDARMNVPGVADGNWMWRLDNLAKLHMCEERLRDMTRLYGRSVHDQYYR